MRLTCPNCNAQYEIPEGMIPPEGREVQCSNCGEGWYQEGAGRSDPPRAAERPEGAPAARRPAADEATLDVLREERAHEARARAAERRRSRALTRGIPNPPPADAPPNRSERARVAAAAEVARARQAPPDAQAPGRAAPARDPVPETPAKRPKPAVPRIEDDLTQVVARTINASSAAPARPDPVPDPAPKALSRAPRRTLLPDIEEINSSLRPDERAMAGEEVDAFAPDEPPPTSGFGLGFAAMIVGAFVAVSIYALSGLLIDALPILARPHGSYADWVDGLRTGLELRVDDFTSQIMPEG